MNAINEARRNLNRFQAARRIEPTISAAETQHFGHAIAVMQFEKERADDVVQAGTKSAASDDSGARSFRIEEKFRERPGEFE